jgi:lysophospholipase L1-like esterase
LLDEKIGEAVDFGILYILDPARSVKTDASLYHDLLNLDHQQHVNALHILLFVRRCAGIGDLDCRSLPSAARINPVASTMGGHRRTILLLLVALLVVGVVAVCIVAGTSSRRNSRTRRDEATTVATSVEPSASPPRTATSSFAPTTASMQMEGEMNLCHDSLLVEENMTAMGECRCEPAWKPVRRDENANWAPHHEHLIEAATYFGEQRDVDGGVDVVWLGDSLVEFMNGTHLGDPVASRRGNPSVFRQAFVDDNGIRAIAVGSSGDTTNNLLYHLTNGVYEPLRQTKIWIITAGTNNLGMTQNCSRAATFDGIVALAHFLKEGNPMSIVVIHGLLPRGGPQVRNKYSLGRYWDWIQSINAQLKVYCDESAGGCVYAEAKAEWFLTVDADPQLIRNDTMSDAIHPDTSGNKLWIPMVASIVRELLEELDDI